MTRGATVVEALICRTLQSWAATSKTQICVWPFGITVVLFNNILIGKKNASFLIYSDTWKRITLKQSSIKYKGMLRRHKYHSDMTTTPVYSVGQKQKQKIRPEIVLSVWDTPTLSHTQTYWTPTHLMRKALLIKMSDEASSVSYQNQCGDLLNLVDFTWVDYILLLSSYGSWLPSPGRKGDI